MKNTIMNSSLRLAIVGTGQVATGNYLPVLREQKDVVLGMYNRDPSKAEKAANAFNGEHLASIEAVAKWNPASVFVLTSESARFGIVMELIRLGVKRIFCEKPLVAQQGQAHVTEDDFHCAKTMLETARENECQVAMNFNYRAFDQTIKAKKIAAERNFGKVTQIAGQVHYACWSHCIDLVHYLAGPMEEMTALSGTVDRQGQGAILAPDVAAVFRMENQAMGTLIGTAGMKWQHPLFEMIFSFENGRIHMRDIDGDLEVLDGSSPLMERYSQVRDNSRWDHYGASFGKAIPAYLNSIRNATEPPVSGMDGLRELQAEAAMKRSIASHRPVRVQVEFPLL
ncbi:MAG: Gfo/Idh/MocA family protein [Chthoniobacteraceae bacterium]